MDLKRVRSLLGSMKRIQPDKHRKSIFRILKDLWWIKKESPFKDKRFQYYFDSLAFKKDAGAINDYLPMSVILSFKKKSRHYKYKGFHPILGDKGKFKEVLNEKNVPSIPVLGKIKDGILKSTIDQNEIDITDKRLIKPLITKWIGKNRSVFVKQVDSQSGKGVFKISNFKQFEALNLQIDKEYLIEEEIKQVKYFNQINPNCIISLRVIALQKGGDAQILGCYFRTGYGEATVDNASAGGIMVRYDIKENKLDELGHQKWVFGGRSYLNHPNTGFIFKDKPLPYPDKVVQLIKKAAKIVPDKELVGWDVAYTENGPILMEGNDNPALISQQITYKGLLHNKYFKGLIDEYFLENGTLKVSD